MLESTQNRILDTINNFADLCYDISVDSKDLKPIVNGKMEFYYNQLVSEDSGLQEVEQKSVTATQSAESQFLTKISVPVNFFHRCPVDLQQQIIDYFNRDRDYLLRCVVETKEGDYCRAVLSSIFTTNYDNRLVFPVILQALENIDVSLRTFLLDPLITRMELTLSDSEVNYKNTKLIPGIMITNSETGHSSLWIEPVVIVNNSYILASRRFIRSEMPSFRRIHKGNGVSLGQISQTVSEAIKASQVGVVQYMELIDTPVKIDRALEFVSSLDALPKRMVAIFENEWRKEEELRKDRVLRDILLAAKELPILNQISIEQASGSWAGMFQSYTSRLAKIQESMERLGVGE